MASLLAASMQDYPDMHADKPCVTCCLAPFGTQPAAMIAMQDYPDMHADKPWVTCKVLPRMCCHAVSRTLWASATQKLIMRNFSGTMAFNATWACSMNMQPGHAA